MKQVLRKGLNQIVVDEVPDPVLVPHHVIVRPAYSLISSGTEAASLHQEGVLKEVLDNPSHLQRIWEAAKLHGPVRTVAEVKAKFDEYAILGYSGAGVVSEKHPSVRDIELGERVTYGGEGTGHAESILVGRHLVARIPDPVPFRQACFTTLGSIALNAVRTADIGIGEVVAILGMGLVGQLVAQLVNRQGGIPIAIDLKPERVELARRLGSPHALLATGASLREAVEALTGGRGADRVIVAAAAKSALPCQQAVEICRDRGHLVIVGAVDLSFPWQHMYRKEIQLFMARAYGPGSYDSAYERQGQDYPLAYVRWTENRNMEEFLRLVALGQVQVEPLITHEYPLEQAATAYQTILDSSRGSLAVVLRYPDVSGSTKPLGVTQSRRKIEIRHPQKRSSLFQVALVGAGNLARWVHLPNLRRIPDASLRAICSSNGARAKSYSLRFGAEYCCSDYQEIINDPKIDVVLIVSRHKDHYSQALAALQAGKHVFVEKPLALTEEECRILCRAEEETGRHLTVGFNRRFAPFYVKLKQHLAGRTAPAVLNCRINSPGLSGGHWAADPAIGGAIVGEACHFVDLMYWLLNQEPTMVSAFCLPRGRQEPIGENNLVASFLFADCSIGNLTYCTVGHKTSAGERVEAFVPGLGAVSENFKYLRIFSQFGRTQRRWLPEKGYADQLKSFFSRIREGKPQEIRARDGARATLGCLCMLESAKTSTPRSIDLEAALG